MADYATGLAWPCTASNIWHMCDWHWLQSPVLWHVTVESCVMTCDCKGPVLWLLWLWHVTAESCVMTCDCKVLCCDCCDCRALCDDMWLQSPVLWHVTAESCVMTCDCRVLCDDIFSGIIRCIYAPEMKPIQLHDSIMMASPWNSIVLCDDMWIQSPVQQYVTTEDWLQMKCTCQSLSSSVSSSGSVR
jgi:hypothetical protein